MRRPAVRAYAFYPSTSVNGGDAYFEIPTSPEAGNRDYRTILHELGHSLGLKHGQEGFRRAAGEVQLARIQRHDLQLVRGEVRAHCETWGASQTFGCRRTSRRSSTSTAPTNGERGNTTYTWNPTTGATFINGDLAIQPGANRILMAIWDGNGIDTYDLSNYSTDLRIDLTRAPARRSPPPSSRTSTRRRRRRLARGNVFNAFLFSGNAASLIENAIGGNGQRLVHRQPGEQRPERRQRQRHAARRRRQRHADRRQRQRRHRGPGRNRQRAGRGRQRPLRLQRRLRLSQHHQRRRQRRHLRLQRDRWRVQRRGDRDRPRRGLLRHRRHDDADRARERARVGQQRDDPRQRAGQQPAGQRRGRPDLRPAGQRQPVRRFRQRYAQRRPERRCHERRRGQRHLLRRQRR